MPYIPFHAFSADSVLYDFIETEALPGTNVDPANFWQGLAGLLSSFSARNAELLRQRDDLQLKIDDWHKCNEFDPKPYKEYLREIGYLHPEPAPFKVTTQGTDDEIAHLAGPQLVVPVSNARYALNAANARWGSLYDALYGTDALLPVTATATYDPARGAVVQAQVKTWLDRFVPLSGASHGDVIHYQISQSTLRAITAKGEVSLQQPSQFVGFSGSPGAPNSVLLRHNGLHLDLIFNRAHPVGKTDPAGLADVIMEAALSAIMDMEDSVAAVDASDKVSLYRNWLGLIKGTLTEQFEKRGEICTRALNPDRIYKTAEGDTIVLPGRSLMLARNVGIHMYSDMVLDSQARPVPEGLVDLMVTALIARHESGKNSRAGSAYIVKPKMHGPLEVQFVVDTFAYVENALQLPDNMLKIGIMDEERRTSANLMACLEPASTRVFFINTGFLDRTGDEIHTSMHAGPVVRKSEMKQTRWIKAYEAANVQIGLSCGLPGHGQIGKGMWAAPDRMKEMLDQKVGHPSQGASTAWVPSPTAAVLHALHYHLVDVENVQKSLGNSHAPPSDDLLIPPLAERTYLPEEIAEELDNNLQGVLGYVVRWIDQGIGCSKVPDIHDIGLMEDRATLRISSQHVANWLLHGLVDRETVLSRMKYMAQVVDRQNADDPSYRPMAPAYDGIAFKAACELVLDGGLQPNGYTEFILHRHRKAFKTQNSSISGQN